MNNPYMKELQAIKPEDNIISIDYEADKEMGYDGIGIIWTWSNAYTVVDKNHKWYKIALKFCSEYSYKGELAVYLDCDIDATKFYNSIPS